MIRLHNLNFKYRGATDFALADMNLEIGEGEFVGVIGGSGAGKTTLTYALNGVVPHYYGGDFYGRAEVNGLDTIEAGPAKLSEIVGSVFQDIDGQMVASIVEDELLFGLENFGVPRKEIGERLAMALETLGISDLRDRAIATLSGGQKQKVAIAAIVALKPRVLVLDEPTGELDPKSSVQVFEMLKKLNEDFGMTVVVVEQKIMLLCEYVRRLIVMGGGRALLDGTVRDVLQNAEALGAAGVSVPRVTSLAVELKRRGLYAGSYPASVPEAERMVREVLA
ncbi:MAG: ATP-binding cassette domain-containing protein [Clostridiales bacterium]|nr:ATP-binding cassette domain-containing protein [Clostridiales bacterium]